MKQSAILVIVYVIIIIVVIIFMWKFTTRGYSRRVLSDVNVCPFGKEKYFPVQQIGDPSDAIGLVCYSLYGNYAKYAPTLYKQLDEIPKELPGWKAVVYTPIDVPDDVIEAITSRNGVIVKMNGGESFELASAPDAPKIGIKGHEGALWRFLGTTQTKPFICLDADDKLYKNIGKKVKKWLASGKTFFIFKPLEILLPMAAGRWGGRGIPTNVRRINAAGDVIFNLEPPIPNMLDMMNEYCEHWFGFDECFLKRRVFKQYVKKIGVYRSAFWPINEILIFIIIAMIIASVITLAAARSLDKEIKECRLR